MIKIPDPDRYLAYTYLDDAPEPELNFVERPLAMLHRTLMASRGRIRHVQTTELALARVKDFLPTWAETALKGMDNYKKRQNFRDDPFLCAVADLQPALAALLADVDTQPCEDQTMQVFRTRQTLHPLLQCFEEDRSLLLRAWEAFLEGRKASLPDWSKQPFDDKIAADNRNDMSEKPRVRDVPQAEALGAEQ